MELAMAQNETEHQGSPSEGGATAIDLWCWPLEVDDRQLATVSAVLDETERARAARFVFDRDKRAFAMARGQLRRILASYVGGDPRDIAFAYGKHGKPALEGHTLPFNLSHSAGLAAAAIAPDVPNVQVGVDIEGVREVERALARRYFSEAEIRDLEPLDGQDWQHGFFRCWTRKEAVIKALGDGLYIELDAFDVTLLADDAPRLKSFRGDAGEAALWAMEAFSPRADVFGAIAVYGNGQPIAINHRDISELASMN